MLNIGVQFLYNHAKKAEARYDRAARAGIVAASEYLLSELRKAYNDYYTSGNFRSTLQIRQALRRAAPEKDKDGWYTLVGVPTATVTPGRKAGDPKSLFDRPVDRGLVALGWELGHYNVFLRRKISVPIAVPTAAQASKGMETAWARVVKRYMEAP